MPCHRSGIEPGNHHLWLASVSHEDDPQWQVSRLHRRVYPRRTSRLLGVWTGTSPANHFVSLLSGLECAPCRCPSGCIGRPNLRSPLLPFPPEILNDPHDFFSPLPRIDFPTTQTHTHFLIGSDHQQPFYQQVPHIQTYENTTI